MIFEHQSVLLYETVDSLNIKPDGIYVDGTLGGGGHAFEVAKRLGSQGRLIGIDQDGDAIKAASSRLEPFRDKVTVVQSNYVDIARVLKNLDIQKVDGIYLDLGVSSYQLDTPERGFTYREENAPLDMRMDQRKDKTAAIIVNTYSEQELFRIIRDYGEDRFAKNIAKPRVRARRDKPTARRKKRERNQTGKGHRPHGSHGRWRPVSRSGGGNARRNGSSTGSSRAGT